MEIRQLNINDTQQFCDLIVDMYSHIDNLEWFTPMPYDYENVKGMIEHPRFYIVGLFVNNKLVGVSSLDYKCGKLIGKIDFPTNFDENKMVEIGFNLVHSSFKGNKAMQLLIEFVLMKARIQGLNHVFSKVHIDNIASNKSFFNKGFEKFSNYTKEVDKKDFEQLSNTSFFSETAKPKAIETLNNFKDKPSIIVNYNILTKVI